MHIYNPFKKIEELDSKINVLDWEIIECNSKLKIKNSEIDAIASQLEEARATSSVLERWLAEVRLERDEFKEKLYLVSGINKRQIDPSTDLNLERLPTIGKPLWSTVRRDLEARSKVKNTPVTKENLDELEKEIVGDNNASK